MPRAFSKSLPGVRAAGLLFLASVAIMAVFAVSQSDATARVIGMSPTASYNGGTISRDGAAKKGLSCIQDAGGQLTCFDSSEEMMASSVARAEKAKADGASVVAAGRKRHKAKASIDCGLPSDAMGISQHGDFNYNNSTGWNIAGYARQNWYDMTGMYANSASSVSAGNHSGYLADNYGGGTPRLRLEINQCERWLDRVYFNDRAQSRYRN